MEKEFCKICGTDDPDKMMGLPHDRYVHWSTCWGQDDEGWHAILSRRPTDEECYAMIKPFENGDFSLESFVAALPKNVEVLWMRKVLAPPGSDLVDDDRVLWWSAE